MAQVFLSYARDDVGRAKALAAAIERAGFSVWWDRDLEGGAEYSREIDEALKAATVIIVLWSKPSVGSAWVRDEAAAGRDTGRLVPVRLDNVEPPLGFRQYQTIDLSRWNGRSESAGVKTLLRAVAAKAGRGTLAGTAGSEATNAHLPTRRLPIKALLAGLFALAVIGLGYLWFARQAAAGVPTVAIVSAPDAADRAQSERMARDLSIDVGTFRIASVDAFELRDADAPPGKADYVIRVSSLQRGGSGTVALKLTSVSNAQILWTGNYEASANDGELRQQVAMRIATLLACLSEARPASGQRLDDPSMKLYLRGCERLEETVLGLGDSEPISLFRQVTERAPRFAPAWATLAYLESSAVLVGQSDDRGIENQARDHLSRARALDPTLGNIYIAEANLLGYRRWQERLPILEEGLRRDPDHADLYGALSIDLRQAGYVNDAADSALRAAALNPPSARLQAATVAILAAAGRVDEARRQLERIERLWPRTPVVLDARYAFHLRYGDPAEALAMVRHDPKRSSSIIASTTLPNPAVERFLEARIDPSPAKVDAAASAFLRRWEKDPTTIDVTSLVALGKVDLAYRALQNPVTRKSYASITGVFFRSQMREFRKDPRFMPLVARMGLVEYWQRTGKWPDFCLDADLPYDCKREAAKLVRAGKAR